MSLILSLPDNWDYTTRGLAAICKESKDTISKIVKELESEGHIIREQERFSSGKLGKIIYTIYEEPCPKNPVTVKPSTDKPCLVKPCLDTLPQLNTLKESNTDVIKHLSNQSPEPIDVDSMEDYRKIIHENIEYDVIISNEPRDKEYVDEIVEVMVECCVVRGSVKIGGYEFNSEVVKSRMLKINYGHIEYILHTLSNNTTKIRNMKAYLRTTIYNSPTTINSFYRAEVNHDFK
jgi:hypothetical protein